MSRAKSNKNYKTKELYAVYTNNVNILTIALGALTLKY